MPSGVVFHWTQNSGLNHLSFCHLSLFSMIIYFMFFCMFLFFVYFYVFFLSPFSSLSDMLRWMLWPHVLLSHTSGYEVFGKEGSCRDPSSLLITLIIGFFSEFWALIVLEPLHQSQGEMPYLWVFTFQCVSLLFAIHFVLFWMKLVWRDSLCRLNPVKLILWLGKEY